MNKSKSPGRRKQPKTRKMIEKSGIESAVSVIDEIEVKGIKVHRVKVKDGYHQNRYKIERFGSKLFAARLEAFLAKRDHIHFDHSRNVARKLLYALPSFSEWSSTMPGALALEPIHHPELSHLPTGKRLDPITRRLFRHGLDPVGVRSRTIVGAWLARDYVKNNPKDISWVSFAGGTAAPTLLMMHAAKVNNKDTSYLNIDLEEHSIEIAKQLTKIEGLDPSKSNMIVGDIFDKKLIDKYVKPGSVDIIDLMGIFEYLNTDDSVRLLKQSYALLKKGGIIIAGNMRTDHPQLNLHKRGVGWPGVIPRNVKDIKELTSAAGVKDSQIDLYRPGDGVYNVVRIVKG